MEKEYQLQTVRVSLCTGDECTECVREEGTRFHSRKGPAIVYADQRPDEYWLHGKKLTKLEWLCTVDHSYLDLLEYIRTEREREEEKKK